MEPSKVFNYISIKHLPLNYQVHNNNLYINCKSWDIWEIDDLIMTLGGTREGFIVIIQMESKMLKELNEALDGLELVLVQAKKIAKDGVSLADLPEAVELVKHIDVIVEAVKGADQIPAELKDIKEEDLMAVGLKVFHIVKAVKEA